MRYIGYVRVSRVNQREGDSFISPDIQKEKIEAWAKLQDHELVGIVEDLDQSGGKLSRPGLDKALALIETGDADGIVVHKLDRLSRAGVADALKLIEWITDHGGKLAAIDLGLDPTTPFGEFGLTLMLGLARMQRRYIADAWRDSIDKAIDRGAYLGGTAPFGFLKGEGGRLEVDPAHADLVPEIFKRRASGESWKALASDLEERKIETSRGNKHWSVQTLKWMINNRAYLGESSSGDKINLEAHSPLIDASLFKAANRTRQVASSPTGKATGVLSGTLRCSGCRYCMKATMGKTRHGKPYLEYRCKAKSKDAGSACTSSATIKANVIEPYVEEFVRSVLERSTIEAQTVTTEIEKAQEALEVAELELSVYQTATENLDPELLRLGLEERIDRAKSAERELETASQKMALADLELKDDWDEKSVRERQEIYKIVLDSVFVWRLGRVPVEDRVVIYPLGTGPTDLPVKGKLWRAKFLPHPDPEPPPDPPK